MGSKQIGTINYREPYIFIGSRDKSICYAEKKGTPLDNINLTQIIKI